MTPAASLVARLRRRFLLHLGREWIAYAQLYSARLVGQMVGMVLAVISARMLQPEGRGEFVTVSAGAVIGTQALNLGLSSSLAVLFSRRPERIDRYRRHLPALAAAWAMILGSAGLLLHWVGLGLEGPLRWWPFWTAWIPLQLLSLYQGAALVARGDGEALSRIELIGRLSAILLGVGSLLAFGSYLRPFLGALILADGIVAGLGALHLARASRRRPYGWTAVTLLKAAFTMGLRAYPLLLLLFLLVKSDIFVLRAFRGAGETGVYSIASQIVDVAIILPATIGALALPAVVRAKNPTTELLRLMRPTALLVGILAVSLVLFGHWGIVHLFGRPYEGAYPALLLLLPGFSCLSLQGLLGQYFASRGFPLFLAFYLLAGFVVNLGLNLLLVPRFGLLAAAATSSLGYALVFFLTLRRFLAERSAQGAG